VPVIDRAARQQLAEGLRHLVAGQITNDEFEDRFGRPVLRSKDAVVREIFWSGAWMLYSDLEQYRLRGSRALPRSTRREIARWILFLRSDLPYSWPLRSGTSAFAWVPIHLLTLGASAAIRRRRWRRSGESMVWPFRSWGDYRAALRTCGYLAGDKKPCDLQR
jgi:hypothetical protein